MASAPRMPDPMILYVGVANKRCILAEYCAGAPDVSARIRKVLPSVVDVTSKTHVPFGWNDLVLHVLPEPDSPSGRYRSSKNPAPGSREAAAAQVRYLCLAHQDYRLVLPMQALEAVAARFQERFDVADAGLASEGEAATVYGPKMATPLRATLLQFTDPATQKISDMRGRLDEARSNIADSLEATVQRGAKLDEMAEASLKLQRHTATFSFGAKRMETAAQMEVLKSRAILGGVVFLFLVVVALLVCGSGLCIW
jgi:hypothetical protein